MAQIGNVPEINEVKSRLQKFQESGTIKAWELPYENLLTRLTAAIFFLSLESESEHEMIWSDLKSISGFKFRKNEERTLSELEWRVEFNDGFEL